MALFATVSVVDGAGREDVLELPDGERVEVCGQTQRGRRHTHIRPAARTRSVLVEQPMVDTARVEFVPAREHSHPIAFLELGEAHSALFLVWTTLPRPARKALDDGLRRPLVGLFRTLPVRCTHVFKKLRQVEVGMDMTQLV